MLAKLLLLLAAASAFGRGNTMTTAISTKACENNDNRFDDSCNNNNNNNNVLLTQQRQQFQRQRQHQRDTQQQHVAAQLRLKSEQQLQQNQQKFQQQQNEEELQFDPFDFANLRRLQQLNEYYDDSNSNSNNNKRQQQRDQDSTYSNNNNSDNNGNDYFYKHDDNNNNNNNNIKSNINGNPSSNNRSPNYSRAPSPPHPDASNDFRLQLSSASNVGSTTGTHVANTKHNRNNNNNNNNNNKNINNNNNNKYEYGDNDQHSHSIAVRSKSFANADHTNAAVPLGMKEYYEDAQEEEEQDEMIATADDYDELGMKLPYGIQNVRKRTIRGSPNSEHRGKSTTYQSLCPTKRVSIPLETVGFEYRPNHYIEVTCAHNYAPTHNYDFNKNKICSEAGFSCIQLNRTIHLIRRNKAATEECWESEIRIVPSGCECMWPKHSYGDIIAYHETQKRYSAQANVARPPTADDAYQEAASSYLQIPRQVELIGLDGQRRKETEGIGFEAYEFN